MTLTFAPATDAAIPLDLVDEAGFDPWLAALPEAQRAWVQANGFRAKMGTALALPGDAGVARAVLGCGSPAVARRKRFGALGGVTHLPEGTYAIKAAPADLDMEAFALGWLLNGYRFDRYAALPRQRAVLVAPQGIDAARTEIIAAGEALTRDLINTPASDMGPDALEAAAQDLAESHDASLTVLRGDALLEKNFPLIHTVGRAAAQLPRLIDMTWGTQGPTLTLVGKGVCFDTGGLNLKPGASMGLMKKDMGGAASVLGLAHMIMALDLPLQLRVLIPAVENAVDGSAFRPGDILTSRKGLTVEINNTDAEGRLVLADALALAAEQQSDVTISMATLTGAARVAVGPDLAPYYCDDEGLSAALMAAGSAVHDPLWRLPFHDPYEAMIEPGIADLDNAPKGGFAGSITAALFLRRFAGKGAYVHFDIYGWQPAPAPARPKGGVGQGTRAVLEALPKMLGL